MIELFDASRDEVIRSSVAQGKTTYRYANEHLFPLINKFDEQRKLQRRIFYERLRSDIISGCIMPPITLAFVSEANAAQTSIQTLSRYLTANIAEGYILDGMQRLNTLREASNDRRFDDTRPLYVNVIIAERYDLLLYRMITLNNGQKPMTARHQIEMLTKGLLDVENLNISIVSEKETEAVKPQGAFRQSDVAEAYTAFLTNNVHNQNSRIIETKLDELLVGKVMDSKLNELPITFRDVIGQIDRLSANIIARDWLRLGNNLIGFAVGMRTSHQFLGNLSTGDFERAITVFESAFSALDVSRINVGKSRRELSKIFVARIKEFYNSEADELIEAFHIATLTD